MMKIKVITQGLGNSISTNEENPKDIKYRTRRETGTNIRNRAVIINFKSVQFQSIQLELIQLKLSANQ